MRYYLIAGEASGDMHGANLMKGILQTDPKAQFRFWGGDRMQAAADQPAVKHIQQLAFMGFWEVVRHLPTILSNLSFCKKDIEVYKPDAVVLIDYPGFNFRLFKFLKQQSIPIIYYISPQLWAWKKNRVFDVKKYVDRLYVIFPFEVDFYKQYGVEAHYFGHPLLDELNRNPASVNVADSALSKQIALLPGSRKQEISYLLPEYMKVVKHFPNHTFRVAALGTHGTAFYESFGTAPNVEFVFDKTYQVLENATAALVTSGTATLETALKNVPEVICYKGSWLSYQIAKRLIKGIDFICIVNLIMNRAVVQELIQDDVNEQRLVLELGKLLEPTNRSRLLEDYAALKLKLGLEGASEKIAADLCSYLVEKSGKKLLSRLDATHQTGN